MFFWTVWDLKKQQIATSVYGVFKKASFKRNSSSLLQKAAPTPPIYICWQRWLTGVKYICFYSCLIMPSIVLAISDMYVYERDCMCVWVCKNGYKLIITKIDQLLLNVHCNNTSLWILAEMEWMEKGYCGKGRKICVHVETYNIGIKAVNCGSV